MSLSDHKQFFFIKNISIGTVLQVEALHAICLTHFHASVTKIWLLEYRSTVSMRSLISKASGRMRSESMDDSSGDLSTVQQQLRNNEKL